MRESRERVTRGKERGRRGANGRYSLPLQHISFFSFFFLLFLPSCTLSLSCCCAMDWRMHTLRPLCSRPAGTCALRDAACATNQQSIFGSAPCELLLLFLFLPERLCRCAAGADCAPLSGGCCLGRCCCVHACTAQWPVCRAFRLCLRSPRCLFFFSLSSLSFLAPLSLFATTSRTHTDVALIVWRRRSAQWPGLCTSCVCLRSPPLVFFSFLTPLFLRSLSFLPSYVRIHTSLLLLLYRYPPGDTAAAWRQVLCVPVRLSLQRQRTGRERAHEARAPCLPLTALHCGLRAVAYGAAEQRSRGEEKQGEEEKRKSEASVGARTTPTLAQRPRSGGRKGSKVEQSETAGAASAELTLS